MREIHSQGQGPGNRFGSVTIDEFAGDYQVGRDFAPNRNAVEQLANEVPSTPPHRSQGRALLAGMASRLCYKFPSGKDRPHSFFAELGYFLNLIDGVKFVKKRYDVDNLEFDH
jgi:hypothetical protein